MRFGSTQRYRHLSPGQAQNEWRRAIPLALLVSALLALAGACATVGNTLGTSETQQQKAQEIIPMLQTAGFDPAPATTPPEVAQLKSLPPLKLGYYIDKNGTAQYWMADPDDCKCIMHGDEAAYQRYENLKLENEVAERDRRAIEAQQQGTGMGMGMGGPGMGFGFGNGGFGGGGFGFGGGGMGIAF